MLMSLWPLMGGATGHILSGRDGLDVRYALAQACSIGKTAEWIFAACQWKK